MPLHDIGVSLCDADMLFCIIQLIAKCHIGVLLLNAVMLCDACCCMLTCAECEADMSIYIVGVPSCVVV